MNEFNQLSNNMPDFVFKKWLNTNEAAKYLSTSPKNIRNLIYRGILKYHKLGGRLRFKKSELDQALKSSYKGGF
jgi:excisionase family DNA binding protein